MTPYPAEQSKNATVTAKVTTDFTVSGGDWKVVLKLGVLPVKTVTGKLCNISPDCTCPCAPGNHTIAVSVLVDSFAPSSSDYTGAFTATDSTGAQIGCFDFAFQVGGDSAVQPLDQITVKEWH
uniref:MD-2-related lipid-recognition domain-containing protein n=1 Tax=Stereomyxa ramosa TaxID=1078864 RepID=A0A7S2EZ60_9EUKA|mmetsp:Transcript_753/g.943  ORF Transcript_753/g.943 Transcript_753/m.943 type:complete len:123 (+) Transcript_753:1-369(+)